MKWVRKRIFRLNFLIYNKKNKIQCLTKYSLIIGSLVFLWRYIRWSAGIFISSVGRLSLDIRLWQAGYEIVEIVSLHIYCLVNVHLLESCPPPFFLNLRNEVAPYAFIAFCAYLCLPSRSLHTFHKEEVIWWWRAPPDRWTQRREGKGISSFTLFF